MKICPVGVECLHVYGHRDGRTERTNVTNIRFHNFPNAPKNAITRKERLLCIWSEHNRMLYVRNDAENKCGVLRISYVRSQ